ncbi:hypothetical protein EJ03DRAFT_302492 [Teratosphaeria nubilosa]|uniref:Nucleotide-diphospho-sugar transferase n=1 Tax=Teratosphaeria nubilosa TaxID=161662 RepID=A0A6G1KV19_9PEZI|nr:hypothetical protein EJ03DRAFT_302492 [Teratosphaeria nubilosa]
MLAQLGRPAARWIAVAAVLLILLVWHTGPPDNLSIPRFGTSSPPATGPKTEGVVTGATGDGRQHMEVPNVVANPSRPDVVLDTRPDAQDADKFPDQPTAEQSAWQEAQQAQSQQADSYLEHFKRIVEEPPMSVKDTKATCHWTDIKDVDFQFGDDADWVVQDRSDAEIAAHQKEWHDFVKSGLIPYETVAPKFSGKGIVVCAGNERSLLRLQVLLRMLGHLQSKVPVEVHYFGDEELSEYNRTDLQGMYPNTFFNDLNGPDVILSTKHENFWINYNVKTASLLNSRFAEPLLMDSDNVPVSDPAGLWTSESYKNFGTVFWPDIARTRKENPMWAITNTPCKPDEYEQESGQLLVDKRRFWYHLQLAAWFGHQDYYQKFLLGDKDCFRFAWHALKTPYGRPARWLTSVGYVGRPKGEPDFPHEMPPSEFDDSMSKYQGGVKSTYCGHSFGQHHPDGVNAPIQFVHGGLLKTLDNARIIHMREHGGFFSAYKASSKASVISAVTEKVHIKYDGGDYASEEGLEHGSQCTDMDEVVPRPIGDSNTKELVGFEDAFSKAGGFWMLNETLWNDNNIPNLGG